MMKTFALLCSMIVCHMLYGQSYSLHIRVHTKAYCIQKMELNYSMPWLNEKHTITGELIGDEIVFTGKLTEPVYAQLQVNLCDSISGKKGKTYVRTIVLDSGFIALDLVNPQLIKVVQSGINQEREDYMTMSRIAGAGTRTGIGSSQVVGKAYVREHPISPLSFVILRNLILSALDTVDLLQAFHAFPDNYQNLPSGKLMKDKLNKLSELGEGASAPDFQQPDAN